MEIEISKKIILNLLDTFLDAGKMTLGLREKGLRKELKMDNTPVTNADIEVNTTLTNKIKKITPDIPIVSEESSLNKKNFQLDTFWLIDPIDGTNDYINNKDEFTLNAGLIINKIPQAGIIYAPAKKRLFYSYGIGNAFEEFEQKKIKLECKKKTKPGEVSAVSNTNILPQEIFETHKKFNVKNYTNMRSSYKFCVVASGEYDLYASKPRAYEWDIAAGHAIVIHAGGIVTTLDEKKFNYGKDGFKNLSLLVRRSITLDR